MNKNIFKLCFIVIVNLVLVGCLPQEKSQGIIWEIRESNNTAYVTMDVYAFGENHFYIPDKILTKYRQSDQIYFDVDPNEKFNILCGPTNGLKRMLSSKTYFNVVEFLLDNKYPTNKINKFTPNGISLVMLFSLCRTFKIASISSMLCESNDQINYSNNLQDYIYIMNNKYPNEYVNYSVDSIQHQYIDYKKIYENWQTGNVKAGNKLVNEYVEKYKSKYPNIYRIVFTDSIKFYENKLDAILKSNSKSFIIIPFYILLGSDGLINKLEKNDKYEVKQL